MPAGSARVSLLHTATRIAVVPLTKIESGGKLDTPQEAQAVRVDRKDAVEVLPRNLPEDVRP